MYIITIMTNIKQVYNPRHFADATEDDFIVFPRQPLQYYDADSGPDLDFTIPPPPPRSGPSPFTTPATTTVTTPTTSATTSTITERPANYPDLTPILSEVTQSCCAVPTLDCSFAFNQNRKKRHAVYGRLTGTSTNITEEERHQTSSSYNIGENYKNSDSYISDSHQNSGSIRMEILPQIPFPEDATFDLQDLDLDLILRALTFTENDTLVHSGDSSHFGLNSKDAGFYEKFPNGFNKRTKRQVDLSDQFIDQLGINLLRYVNNDIISFNSLNYNTFGNDECDK